MNTQVKKQINNLRNKYKHLVEKAYNLRQTDSSRSDVYDYQAMILLNRINRLNYLIA